jgi:integrase/recombinase XerD
MDNDEFLEKFSRKIISSGGDYSTAKTYCNNIGVFMGWGHFDGVSVLLQDQKAFEDYIIHMREQRYENSSINSFIASIKRLYRINGKWMKVKNINYLDVEPKTPNVLTHEEAMRMCNAKIYLKHRVIINLLYYGALRRSELLRMKVQHLSENRRITIVESKYNKSRVIVIPEHIVQLLQEYLIEFKPKEYLIEGEKGGMYSAKSLENVVKNTAVLVGIQKKVNPHLLRSSWATNMLDLGASEMYISEMLGHANVQTTKDYYCRLTKKGMQDNFDRIYGLLEVKNNYKQLTA